MFCFSPLNSEALDIAQAKPHSTKARKAVLTSRAMPPIFKSRIGHGGLSTELQDGTAELYETSVESSVESDVQEPTSMIGAVGGGQMPFFPQKSETNKHVRESVRKVLQQRVASPSCFARPIALVVSLELLVEWWEPWTPWVFSWRKMRRTKLSDFYIR